MGLELGLRNEQGAERSIAQLILQSGAITAGAHFSIGRAGWLLVGCRRIGTGDTRVAQERNNAAQPFAACHHRQLVSYLILYYISYSAALH